MSPLRMSRRLLTFATASLLGIAGWWLYHRSLIACCAPPPLDPVAWLAAHPPAAATPLPSGFAVEIASSTGSLAPPFYYSYTLRIEGSGAATLEYTPGYDGGDSLAVRATYTVSDSVIRVLAALADYLKDPPGRLADSKIPNGGSSPHITLHLDNRVIDVPSYQKGPAGSWQYAMRETAREAIPADVWARCEEAQRLYAATLEQR